MGGYEDYTVEVTLKSPIASSLQSDTIFGHICWAIRFLKWEKEDRLTDFLARYDNKESPPFLLSNGFPRGFLPKPVIPPVTQATLDMIFKKENRIENAFRIKSIKAADLISKESFRELQQTGINPENLFEGMNRTYEEISFVNETKRSEIVQHNTIDRIKGRVKEGGLFSQQVNFYHKDQSVFEIYLKTNYFFIEELERIFRYIMTDGLGADKSTGKGQFTFEVKKGIDVPVAKEPNAFMTLSSYIPSEDDPLRGYYRLLHKFGKLGDLYAKGSAEVYGNPFKVPLIMFTDGSTFYDSDYGRKKVYGSLLKGVHKKEDIRHYAYAFPIGINLRANYEEI
jgi:CRISPR-associated protein Csm4